MMLTEPVLPFQKTQVLDIKGEAEDPRKKKEARVRALMIAMNTMALQTQKLMEEASEDRQTQEQAAREMEHLKNNERRAQDKLKKLQQEATRWKNELNEEKTLRGREWARHSRVRTRLETEVRLAKKQLEDETAKLAKVEDMLNVTVLQMLVNSIEEEDRNAAGVYINIEKLKAFKLHAKELIGVEIKTLLDEISKKPEAPKKEQEDDEENKSPEKPGSLEGNNDDEERDRQDGSSDNDDDEDGDDDQSKKEKADRRKGKSPTPEENQSSDRQEENQKDREEEKE